MQSRNYLNYLKIKQEEIKNNTIRVYIQQRYSITAWEFIQDAKAL
jgi:hypothetical protein